VFYTERLEYPEQIANQLAGQTSVLVASPAQLKRLPRNLDWQRMKANLKAVFSSGGPLSAETADNVTQLWNCRPIEVFGSSETGGIAWRQSEDGSSSWQVLPGVEWHVTDGYLCIRSPHLPDSAWFVTQDRAVLRDGNQFELLGRSDRIIKLEERRISMTSIENSLNQNIWVQECRLLVLPGLRERLAAVVVLSAEGDRVLKAKGKLAVVSGLRNALATSVEQVAIPRRWRFPSKLPVDSQDKTSQRSMIELFRSSIPASRTISLTEESARLELIVMADLVFFDGHFSEHAAVIPGVALIDWAIKHGRALFPLHQHFLRIEALKFQKVIRPDTDIFLDIQWNEAKGMLVFRYESVHGVHASGRIFFSNAKTGNASV
jgi:3-hydroxymyristoyl/3-hydroxydecanoyl-(acyl carrier protein) dehydratase